MKVMFAFVFMLIFLVFLFLSSLYSEDFQESSKELETKLEAERNQLRPRDCMGRLRYQPHEFAGFLCPKEHGMCRNRREKLLDTSCAVVRSGSCQDSKIFVRNIGHN